jgi:hypothetical protein
MINEWIGNYAKGSGRGQSKALPRQLPGRVEETHKNVSKGRGSLDRDMRGHLPNTKEDVRCEVGVISSWSYLGQNLPTAWVKTASSTFRGCSFSSFGGGAYDRAERYDLHQSFPSPHALHAKLNFNLDEHDYCPFVKSGKACVPLLIREEIEMKIITFWDMKPCSPLDIGFQRTTRRYIPEDHTLHTHRCENLKSCKHWNVYDFIIASYSPIWQAPSKSQRKAM